MKSENENQRSLGVSVRIEKVCDRVNYAKMYNLMKQMNNELNNEYCLMSSILVS